MPFSTFPEHLLLGHPLIDAQHREIYSRLSVLLAAVEDHKNKADVEAFLDFALTFMVGHFSTEERLMGDISYPVRSSHVSQHDQFTMICLLLRDEYKESGDPSVIYMKLAGIAGTWFREHIAGTDRLLADFVRQRGTT
jgi:hemerythrin